jgi:hypothetical protein
MIAPVAEYRLIPAGDALLLGSFRSFRRAAGTS